jgi:hypothetical protein
MGFSKEDIMTLIKVGSAISIDVSDMEKNELVEIADLALRADTMVTLRNLGSRSLDDLVAIAKAGGDSIVLEL